MRKKVNVMDSKHKIDPYMVDEDNKPLADPRNHGD